jgi:hypothetical protein
VREGWSFKKPGVQHLWGSLTVEMGMNARAFLGGEVALVWDAIVLH